LLSRDGTPGGRALPVFNSALDGFAQCVREELRDRKIRVIKVYPTATDTNIWSHIEGEWPRHKMISAEDVAGTVAYALSRPADVTLESISISSLAGNL
jgi:NADP-dependent 3-hydroxy acid dehydrogenase YdfG